MERIPGLAPFALPRPRFPKSFLFAAVLLAAAVPSPLRALSWLVPGIANTAGANGTRFFSDLTIVNGGPADRDVTLSLIPGPATVLPPPLKYTVPAGETLRLDNVLGAAWLVSGTGAIRVSTDGPVTLFARTYNVAPGAVIPEVPSPTLGAALPIFEEASLLATGEEGHSGWVTQSSDPAKGDRTNAAVLFPEEAGGTATVTIVGPDGKVLGSGAFDAPQAAFLQKSVASFTTAEVSAGRILVRVTRGRAAAYTATADNGTGDLTIFPVERLPAAAGVAFSAVSSGVAQLPGRQGAFWQTEARLANPSGPGMLVTSYLLAGAALIPRRDFAVPAGATVAIPNLITSLFNLSGSASGAVLWKASAPLLIETRTSSIVNLSFAKGTAGSGQSAVGIDSYLTPEVPADLGDLRAGTFARTNLFLAAGPAGATCAFEARRLDGRLLGSARTSLPALGWGEFNLADLFAPVPLPDRVRVNVSVESGSADVEAAVVDSFTNDSVLYRALPRVALPRPPAPLPPGTWGAADGAEGLKVDAAKIVVDRWCRTGAFPQPLRLDALGRFAVIGDYVVNIGPVSGFTAILAGAADGQTATVSIFQLDGAPLDTPKTYALGMPYKIPPGPCPVEY